ncbi:MAG TPA: M1 family metallopeptidase, partial [Kofleriaceae bacterium]|nr:M1 family metallopeptidase [Kofleriaceae bacterium]
MQRLWHVRNRAFVLLVTLAATGTAASADDRRTDEHSYAEPSKVQTKDLALDLTVDFRAKQLVGTATLTLAWQDPAATELVLDTRDLAIAKAEKLVGETWKPAKVTLGKRDPVLGTKLVIAAERAPKVRITYRTSPAASGLQWMDKRLTATGKQPFMFSQSQAIHARSWVPLQDTPAIRFTYSARVKTPKDLVALMSADNDPELVRDGDYALNMTEPIPSYLLAIAVGDLTFRPISKRAGVWAETPVIDKAVAELADTEAMIVAAEKLYGPYRWGRYDILMLPASFPFGGMENPRLSFITPTILVGDKSLTSLIAHELAHSWSGNLVTNASWKDGWLNEGFTTYFEYRIVEMVYGKEIAEIELVMSQQDLLRRIDSIAPAQTKLRLDPQPRGGDPDELGDVAYEKGQWFLYALELRAGRTKLDAALSKWFSAHAFKTATTDDLTAFIARELPGTEAFVREWVTGTGIPKDAPRARSARLEAVDTARTKWLAGGTKLIVDKWSTLERIHFLDGLPPKLSAKQLDELDATLALTGTQNGEYAERWYPLTIRSGYTKVRPAIVAYIERVGRRKLVMPIYAAFVATPEGRAFAQKT